ncbi:hypothetical protein BH23BAC1_BH23BAC1_35940 [soil metagenome]
MPAFGVVRSQNKSFFLLYERLIGRGKTKMQAYVAVQRKLLILIRIKARLNRTSESWIASIILVLKLVELAGQVPLALLNIAVTFPARCIEFLLKGFTLGRSR